MSAMKFKVAEHIFDIAGIELYTAVAAKLDGPYHPFKVTAECISEDDKQLFRLTLCEDNQNEEATLVYSNKDIAEPGFITLSVYKNESGHYFEFTQPGSEVVNGKLWISADYREANLSLAGSNHAQWLTFNTGVSFCYLLATAKQNTVLAHASCVRYKDKAYLFLGKSGTGKSTHSRMWLNVLDNVILMNDDHPVIRANNKGQVIAYGSPWSGKTPCYKNMQVSLKAVVRLSQAPYNKIVRLAPLQAFASLMPACSCKRWDNEAMSSLHKSVEKTITIVPCYHLECLPDEDAARVCYNAVLAK